MKIEKLRLLFSVIMIWLLPLPNDKNCSRSRQRKNCHLSLLTLLKVTKICLRISVLLFVPHLDLNRTSLL